jgi:glycogen(starch) synthase
VRVLYLVERFWPLIGGVEVISARLLPAMRDRGHEITIVTGREHDWMNERDDFDGIPVHRLPLVEAMNNRDLESIVSIRRTIAGLVEDGQPELIHATFSGPSIFFMPPPSVAPSIVSFHGTWPELRLDPKGIFARNLTRAAWVTACSRDALAHVVAMLPELRGRSSAILNGLDPPARDPAPPPVASPLLFCAGRVVPDKGFDVALHAFAAVAERVPGARMVIAGDGPERAPLAALAARLGVAERVSFPGWVSPDETFDLLDRSTLVLVPSLLEGFGLVALEAMLMGRPVVAARVGGLPEVVADGETGVLVPAGDPGALSAAILALLDDPDAMLEMGQAGRRRALRHFSARRHADEWDALYRRVGIEAQADVG